MRCDGAGREVHAVAWRLLEVLGQHADLEREPGAARGGAEERAAMRGRTRDDRRKRGKERSGYPGIQRSEHCKDLSGEIHELERKRGRQLSSKTSVGASHEQ